jgi:MFS family permease
MVPDVFSLRDSPTIPVGHPVRGKLTQVNVTAGISDRFSRVRATARRDGAGASGLASLMELSFVNAAGDALITVALAGSLFFSVSPAEARSKVALYLLVTMAPFAVLAPVIGPMLDRFPHGRRLALGAVCIGRAVLAWMLASSLAGLSVYPLALGLLVMSKAFGVARSAVVPRVAPREMTLVKVNARLSLVNIVSGSVLAPVGFAIAKIPYVGYPWVLRIAAMVYLVAAFAVFRLPQHVDSAEGERRVRDLPAVPLAVVPGATGTTVRARLARALGSLPVALRTASVLRGLVGFLTFYLAFLLRTAGGTNLWLGGLAIAAGVGSGVGVFVGGRLGRRQPEALLMMSLLGAAGGCIGAALNYTKFTSLLAALLATMAGSVSKLALDAVIQRDIPEDTRTSAFARSETALQLAWVVGGAFGLISMGGTLGFALASALLIGTMFVEVTTLRRTRASRLAARVAARAPRVDPLLVDPLLVDPSSTDPSWVDPSFAGSTFDDPSVAGPGPYLAGHIGRVDEAGEFDEAVFDQAGGAATDGFQQAAVGAGGGNYREPPTLVDPDGPTDPRGTRGSRRRRRRSSG